MTEPVIPASDFKARCLALLDDVARSRIGITVTKYGRPVARLVPVEHTPASTDGSVTILVEDEEALFSTGERWDADV